jgi:hypothetical protein
VKRGGSEAARGCWAASCNGHTKEKKASDSLELRQVFMVIGIPE